MILCGTPLTTKINHLKMKHIPAVNWKRILQICFDTQGVIFVLGQTPSESVVCQSVSPIYKRHQHGHIHKEKVLCARVTREWRITSMISGECVYPQEMQALYKLEK